MYTATDDDLKNIAKQIGSTLTRNITRAKPHNNTKHGEGHADDWEAQAGD